MNNMFRKFTWDDSVSSASQVKSSVQRGIRAKIIDQYPSIESVIDEILPKKSTMVIVKCKDHIQLVTIDNDILFFNHYDGPYFPTLKVLHRYPDIMTKFQVDRGAIKFVLSGAQIMCPGLTSKGAKLPEENIPAETPVAIYAEGKEHAVAVGQSKLSSDEIKSINKGCGVENVHSLLDGLWKTKMDS